MISRLCVTFLFALSGTEAFAPSARCKEITALSFGIPSFGTKENKTGGDAPDEKIGLKGLIQLITAGAGSPFLGDYEGTDPETGKMYFSLEANNLVDEVNIFVRFVVLFSFYVFNIHFCSLHNPKNGDSKQTKMPYFESGWVSEEDLEKERNKKVFKFPWDK